MQQINRWFKAPKDHFFIFGPRGTGKSTWLKKTYPKALLIDLLDHAQYLQYLSDPTFIKKRIDANLTQNQVVIVDEIQKVPALLDAIHALIENPDYQSIQFILTGSSARKLRRTGVNLLGGRVLLTHFHPFIASELGESFDLSFALNQGLVPLIVAAKDPKHSIKTYIGLYLKEEVQAESLVRNLSHFSRFLETMSFSHASLLNLSNIARECQITRKMAENYLSILQDLLLAETLPVFKRRAKRETLSHEKFYYFDAGVFNHLRPKGVLDRQEEVEGATLEGLIFQHLRAFRDYSVPSVNLYYWRTPAGAEVDFIVYGEAGFYAIEIKNSTRVQSKDLKHLKTFCQDYPEAKPLLLYRGQEDLQIDGIPCRPVLDFLKALKPNIFPYLNLG